MLSINIIMYGATFKAFSIDLTCIESASLECVIKTR